MASSRDVDQHESLRLRSSDSQDSSPPPSPLLCSNNCGFFGSSLTNHLCSVCYNQSLPADSSPLPSSSHTDLPASEFTVTASPPSPKFPGSRKRLHSSSPSSWAFSLPVLRPGKFPRIGGSASGGQVPGMLLFSSGISDPVSELCDLQSHLGSETEVPSSPFPPQASSSTQASSLPVPEPSSLSSPASSMPVAEPSSVFPGACFSSVPEPSSLSPRASSLPVLEPSPAPRASSFTVPEPSFMSSACAATGSGPKRSSNRCHSCRKRLCLGATFKCRCGDVFCSSHRFPDQHACNFDIKTKDREAIAKANPVIRADKLQGRI